MLLIFFPSAFIALSCPPINIICNQSIAKVLMYPFVTSNNLYSLYILVTYETSIKKATYGGMIVGHRHLSAFPVFMNFFVS